MFPLTARFFRMFESNDLGAFALATFLLFFMWPVPAAILAVDVACIILRALGTAISAVACFVWNVVYVAPTTAIKWIAVGMWRGFQDWRWERKRAKAERKKPKPLTWEEKVEEAEVHYKAQLELLRRSSMEPRMKQQARQALAADHAVRIARIVR
jgi:hypothetical protein